MKVKELIERLGKLNQDLDIVCYTEDKDLLARKHMFRILQIDGVDVREPRGEKIGNGVPAKFGREPGVGAASR